MPGEMQWVEKASRCTRMDNVAVHNKCSKVLTIHLEPEKGATTIDIHAGTAFHQFDFLKKTRYTVHNE